MNEITRVYEKFKHLDALLSDEGWLDDGRPQTKCLYELWQAVKAYAQEGEK
ncbi:MAG: hypothetical protein U1E51_02660 [Candidatus Binatia bacterium]|nr:hypothetical protein [Candidatus Binatia bacterium]